ncbi:transcription factor bHLH155-like isoform X2 [Rhododendron vialii]|uniref:transcription factor bHLH155-like isoform X2 n=1 Tax=Rhododendron vialii TaxID=182163 RepID=UPI00265E9BAB|nr:transcription factor bHLH155-like isoform X2 [Rhododendron vialii]
MGNRLHEALRTLCFNTGWRYAVLWKLQHRAPMTLTWEDAYYDNREEHYALDNTAFPETGGNLWDLHSHDPLGSAVVKMSCQVYSFGEGVIGQVAVAGKHMWIFADKHVIDSCSPFEHSDGWHAQFSAGIRTVVLVAVLPYGVVQLGSLNKIPENLEMVKYIRDSFFGLQESSVRSSSCLSDISTSNPSSGIFIDRHGLSSINSHVNKDKKVFRAPTFPSFGRPAKHSDIVLLPGDLPKTAADAINKDGGLDLLSYEDDDSAILLQSRSEAFVLKQQKSRSRLHSDRQCEGGTSNLEKQGVSSVDHDAPSSYNSFKENKIYNVVLPANDFREDISYLQADLLDISACNNETAMCIPKPFGMQIQRDLENTVFHAESNKMEPVDMAFEFSAGCELYEVFGPVYQKQRSYCDWEAEKSETGTAIEVSEGLDCSSLLTADSGSAQLLEAVVANVYCGVTDVKSEKSFCESAKSQLTTEEMSQPTCDKNTDGSTGYTFNQAIGERGALCLSSEACGASSFRGFSSRSQSMLSGRLDSAQDPAKINKRARPGGNCRPRPRDRQLIQDRIKELRELVPNGSKVHDKKTVLRGLPTYDHGSTWAVEVGSVVTVCPIMVENINKSGQMLIEMLCEECSHFLGISEAIRSLGLTILEGATEACDKKTLMCFVVEGQNNRSMHRMDILWSLVQILQSKTTI